jgi:plastocyanin
MSASPIHYQKRPARSVSVTSPLLRQLNMSTLALVLFVALALLSTTRGKEPAARESAPAKATKAEVIIDNFRFSPKTFMIPAGATVTRTNHDSAPLVVTSADNQFQQSPVLKTGQSFSDTFPTAGTYSYFCSIHPGMTEKIIVMQLSAED